MVLYIIIRMQCQLHYSYYIYYTNNTHVIISVAYNIFRHFTLSMYVDSFKCNQTVLFMRQL